MKAVSTQEVFEYVCISERELPEHEQTVFLLSPLDVKQRTRLEDRTATMSGEDGQQVVNVKVGTVAIETLRYGLKGWKNLTDKNGKDSKFVTKRSKTHGDIEIPTDDTLKLIPAKARRELANAIDQESFLDEEEVGKSESQESERLED